MLKLCLILISFVMVNTHLNLPENETCNAERWICKRFKDCPWAAESVKRGGHPVICSFDGFVEIVCCPPNQSSKGTTNSESEIIKYNNCENSNECKPYNECWPWPSRGPKEGEDLTICGRNSSTTLYCCSVNKGQSSQNTTPVPVEGRVSRRKCIEYSRYSDKRVIFGERVCGRECSNVESNFCTMLVTSGIATSAREFPHMAQIGYGRERSSINWKCGGSLISENFVLSAAHCSSPGSLGSASWVRLGETAIVRIAQIINHPDYSPKSHYHDISLFKLEERVAFSTRILPICLPGDGNLPNLIWVTGWGHTRFGGVASKTLQKGLLSLVSTRQCNDTYRGSSRLPQGLQEDSQFCAGHETTDACQEDSGGSLSTNIYDPECMLMQFGITSFGKFCGTGHPGVYTKVSHYINWIEKNVWPNE